MVHVLHVSNFDLSNSFCKRIRFGPTVHKCGGIVQYIYHEILRGTNYALFINQIDHLTDHFTWLVQTRKDINWILCNVNLLNVS